MGTLLVLSSLIAVCGFIAYTGDLLGRRLGKRRLTVFGLRPRHTAILCTVITGMVIAGTTLGVLMGLSAGVRRAVLQGEALVRQNQEFRLQRDGLQRETVRLQQEIEPLQQANSRLAQSNRAMETANDDLRKSENALQCQNGELVSANNDARQTLVAVRAERETVRRRLVVMRGQLEHTVADLTKSRRDLDATQKKNLRVLAELAARTRVLRTNADMLALADVEVREGEELARTTVPAYSSREDALAQIQLLLTRVRQTARDRGAKRKDTHLEAYLRNSQLAHMLGPSVDSVNVSERDAVKLLVELVSDCRYDIVLRALAVQNTAETEPIPFDITPYWNMLAFRKGEEIASTTLDPSLTPGQILEQLLALLRTKVRTASIDRQVIPGPRNELGEVRYDPLIEVAEKVKRLGVPAKVGVVAAREVRSADPLRIDFYVVPAETAVAARAGQVTDGKR
jgi:uncharacterized protein (DUF3084 family)